MNNNFKQNTPTYFLILGYVVYFVLLFQTSFYCSVIWMMLLVYLWVALAVYFHRYSLNSFLYVLSASGGLVSLSMLFLKGVEEVPFPEGAIIFHLDGIVQSLFLLFIFSLPLLIKSSASFAGVQVNKDYLNDEKLTVSESADFKIDNTVNQSDRWEEASVEDLESGNFEAL